MERDGDYREHAGYGGGKGYDTGGHKRIPGRRMFVPWLKRLSVCRHLSRPLTNSSQDRSRTMGPRWYSGCATDDRSTMEVAF